MAPPAKGADKRAPYLDTVIPPQEESDAGLEPVRNVPERIHEMKRLYECGRLSVESRAENFLRQARFMRDHEDEESDIGWISDLKSYYPVYHDLSDRQLCGYFAWRTHVRKGDFRKISESAAYIYIYELLNGVGGSTPEECLDKLREFRRGYMDAGLGSPGMKKDLSRWMLEYAVIHGLQEEEVLKAADPDMIHRDEAISALRDPDDHSDEEVFDALCFFGAGAAGRSPAAAQDPERGRRLFSEAWKAARKYCDQGQDLFTLCFGTMQERRWYPLSNAVCCDSVRQDHRSILFGTGRGAAGPLTAKPENRELILSSVRRYYRKDGVWYSASYDKLYYDRTWIRTFLRRADEKFRRYLKTGRYLKEDPAGRWADPYIDAVIEADRKARIEAARPKIEIDLSGLDQIREDAALTRDSLLTDDELIGADELYAAAPGFTARSENTESTECAEGTAGSECSEGAEGPEGAECAEDSVVAEWTESTEDAESSEGTSGANGAAGGCAGREVCESMLGQAGADPAAARDMPADDQFDGISPLDSAETEIVKVLLDGGDPSRILRERRIMPSVAADSISEKLFDEIGDSVIMCEDDKLLMVPDYVDDVRQLLEG